MNEMIDRVAKAIWDSAEVDDWEKQDDHGKMAYRNAARAAIEALLEPSEETKTAFKRWEEWAIDAALAESKENAE